MQPGLFDVPADQPPPKSRARLTGDKPRYTRYKTRTRTLCHDCVRLIHELGTAVAPPPRTARWRRTPSNDLLCDPHKQDREIEDCR